MGPVHPDPDVVARIVAMTHDRPARLGRTRLVCVDGPAGSGKTTLAHALVEAFGSDGPDGPDVALFSFDEVYDGWDGLSAALEPRVLAQVLEPLSRGEPGRWQRYDWYAQTFAEWHDLPPCDVLVAEGCGSGAPAYAGFRTLLVHVEAADAIRLARGIARDGVAVEPHFRRWMQTEAAYFAAHDIRGQADVVLRTDEPEPA